MERKKKEERREKKPVTGYIETMAFNNRSYKRFWWSEAVAGRERRSGPTSSAAGNRYPPCNYRLSPLVFPCI